MPASTLDPVNAALRTALAKNSADGNGLDAQLAGSTKKAVLSNIEFEPAGTYQSSVLNQLKTKYIVLKSVEPHQTKTSKQESMGGEETLSLAKHELYPLHAVQLGWSTTSDWSVGAGMINMGNTCYLNSTLQALFHVPALVNWLISDKQHMSECEDSGSQCIICAMRKTLTESQSRSVNSIRPHHIYSKLRMVCRHLIPGRQEDAHEFLRHLVEAMERSYLGRFENASRLDARTKETTPLNQILGGYLRSAVRCLSCNRTSTTFQHFQDLLVDVRKAQTIEEALDGYFTREQLDDESYRCETCEKKVPATKQFSLERAPMVLCIQLKRFSVSNNKITKHVTFRQRLDLTRYCGTRKPAIPLVYRLVALVTHMGPTVSNGHYTAVAQAPCGNFYQFDDCMVRSISHQAVFSTNAYVMFYELERSPFVQKQTITSTLNPTGTLNGTASKTKSVLTTISANVKTATENESSPVLNKIQFNGSSNITGRVLYGPELPPAKIAKVEDQNGLISSSSSYLNGTSNTISESSKSNRTNGTAIKSPEAKRTVLKAISPKLCMNRNAGSSINGGGTSSSTNGTTAVSSTSHSGATKKLVPYDENDSSSNDSSESSTEADVGKVAETEAEVLEVTEEARITTKVTPNGEWKVTSSIDDVPSEAAGFKRRPVDELLKMSHSGYATASVTTWNGSRANLSKEIANERREDRKRTQSTEVDAGRVKHVKTNNYSNGNFKSNPGYNPVQEYHDSKNWNSHSVNAHFRQFHNAYKHRRRNFHHKKNFHNSYRSRH